MTRGIRRTAAQIGFLGSLSILWKRPAELLHEESMRGVGSLASPLIHLIAIGQARKLRSVLGSQMWDQFVGVSG